MDSLHPEALSLFVAYTKGPIVRSIRRWRKARRATFTVVVLVVLASLAAAVGLIGSVGAAPVPAVPTITSGPTGTVITSSATFKYTDSTSGVTFQCALDSGAFKSCATNGVTYSGLGNG